MGPARLTRPFIARAVALVIREPRLVQRRQNIYRHYRRQGFCVQQPGDVFTVPEPVVRQSVDRIRRHWRRYLAAETSVALALGPIGMLPTTLPLLYILAAWLTESLWARGLDVTAAPSADHIANELGQQLAFVWRGQTNGFHGLRLLAVGWGLEWVWADRVIDNSLVALYSEAIAVRMSSAMSLTASMPTAIRTVPSVMPIARRASSL